MLCVQKQSGHAFLSLQQQNVNKRTRERGGKKAIDHSSRCSTEAFVCLRSVAASLKRHHREREREERDGASTATFVASRTGAAAAATWLLPFLQTIFPPRSKTKDGIRMFYEHALQMRSGA